MDSTNYTWTTTVYNCDTVSSYYWEHSVDGFNYTYLSSGSSYTGQLPNVEVIFLRVTITCSNGETKTKALRILNIDGDAPCKFNERTLTKLRKDIPNI